jgi:outer membrane protein assembly factor BamB
MSMAQKSAVEIQSITLMKGNIMMGNRIQVSLVVLVLISGATGCSKRGKSVTVVEIKTNSSTNITAEELEADWPQWRGSNCDGIAKDQVIPDNWGNGYIAALHRETGEVVWLNKRPAVSTYSTPLLAKIGGRDQMVLSGCDQLVSYDPSNGEQLWACAATSEATCGTPVTDGNTIFASGGHPNKQTVAVSGDGAAKLIWKNSTKIYEPSMLVANGCVFAVSDDGIGWCWSAENGNIHWKQRLGGTFSVSLTMCEGKIFVPNLSGETIVFEASAHG